ncbi:peptidoglycan-binding protein [Streptomyces sp. NPDC051561]|uniref:peptidoglycan-binding protein n=1 Tax=Streptomyces sp. NPDC051561 TaxID=3365658 RepID=UPI0037BCA824
MPDLWMPGARRLDVGDHAPTDGGPAKAIAHITWDRNATAAKPAALVPYETLTDYFGRNTAGRAAAPHLLWDPFTGRVTQFLPANSRSKSLADRAGGTRTNRAGSVVIQIEALFFPYCRVNNTTYARLVDTPCKGWAEVLAYVRSWGVPDVWPMGRPTDFVGRRNDATWRSAAGWFGHSHVPENDHQDPGTWPAFTGSPTTPAPKFEPFPGVSFFKIGRRSPVITAMGRRLVAEGCGKYREGPGPAWTDVDRQSYAAWQRRCNYTGAAADGIPGPTTWALLRVPRV